MPSGIPMITESNSENPRARDGAASSARLCGKDSPTELADLSPSSKYKFAAKV
jgi:hypothetical protein